MKIRNKIIAIQGEFLCTEINKAAIIVCVRTRPSMEIGCMANKAGVLITRDEKINLFIQKIV